MVTLVNLTGSLEDLVGTDFVEGKAKVWIETSVTEGVIVDAAGNQLRIGDAVATITAGAFTFTGLWATNSASNPTSFQYRVWVEYTPKRPATGGTKQVKRWDSGWFSLTATSDLADVVEEQYAPPSWQTTFTTSMQTYANNAAASATAAEVAREGAEDARDAAAQIALGDADTALAVLAADETTAFGGELTNRLTRHLNGFRDMVDKIRNQQNDVNLLIVGDSTSDLTFGGTKWTTGLAAALGALFPYVTVKERSFDYTTTNNWNAATTVQTGTGYRSDLGAPKTLTVWVAGWAAHNWSDWLVDSRRDKVFATPTPDVVVIALGHNDGSDNLSHAGIKSRDLAYIEWMRLSCPAAQFVLCSQNPRILTPGHAEFRNDLYRSLARERGFGYVNVTQAFYDDGRALSGVLVDASDQVHPTTAGYTLWRDTVLKQIKAAPGAVPQPTSAPAMNQVTPRVAGMRTTPILSNGWTAQNVTESVESTITRDGKPSAIRLTKGGSALQGYVQYSVPAAAVRGRDVTAWGWMYVPASAPVAMVGWFVDGVLAVASLPDQVMYDQWQAHALTTHIPDSATTVTFRVWVDNSTAVNSKFIVLDPEFSVLTGTVPMRPVATEAQVVTGLTAPSTWTTATSYAAGATVTFGGSIYQAVNAHTSAAAFRTDVGAGNWTHLGGHGRVETIDPAIMSGYLAWPAALRAYFYRVQSAAAISALGVDIGVQSGNILAAVYTNNGLQGRNAAPSSLIASTGSLACPAVGKASLSLGGTFGVAAGDWIMLAADNITVKFRTIGAAGVSGGSQGRVGYAVLGSLAAPASPTIGVWAPTFMPWVGGE